MSDTTNQAIPRLCILAAGTGSRLGSLTEELNKSLLALNHKAVISYILDQFPKELPVVIAVGYGKDMVIDYCMSVHHDREITFVEVDRYTGQGAGPGYSINCCREYLQQPFYLTTADCLVTNPIPDIAESWIGVFPNDYSGLYSTARVDACGNVIQFKNKSNEEYEQAFVGLAYIAEPDVFWAQMDAHYQLDHEYEFVSAWYTPSAYTSLKAVHFNWHDTGSLEGWEKAKQHFDTGAALGMAKRINEMTYRVGDVVCKLCNDAEKNAKRVARASELAPYVPETIYAGKHALAYSWVDGVTLYQTEDISVYARLLDWCQDNLWSQSRPATSMRDFYEAKTRKRVEQYLAQRGDEPEVVNGVFCPPISDLLDQIDWETISHGRNALCHGDLQFENVLLTSEGEFCLIDWREDFAGGQSDVYYDLAKINGGTRISYERIEQYTAEMKVLENGKRTFVREAYSWDLVEFSRYMQSWCSQHGYDWGRVQLITALVWLNMAPLHVEDVDLYLFSQGKYKLTLLKEQSYGPWLTPTS